MSDELIKIKLDGDFGAFHKLVKIFPSLKADFMSSIGWSGRTSLKMNLLSGQELDLRAYPKDIKGRHTTGSSVGKKANSVSVSSYPANLYEDGFTMKSGRTVPGKKIFSIKLKSIANSRLQNWSNEADKRTFGGAFAKV